MPARSTAEMWTNTSFPPSCGWMKPKPFWELKNFTVPVAIPASIENADRRPCAARRSQPYVRIRRCLGKSPVGQKQEQANLERTLIWAQNGAISTPLHEQVRARGPITTEAIDGVHHFSRHAEPCNFDVPNYFLRRFMRART